MTLAEYSRQALSTWAVDPVAEPERARTHAALMLVAEAGEVAGIYQKSVQGHGVDPARVIDELGDVLWALCACAAIYRIAPPTTVYALGKGDPVKLSLLLARKCSRVAIGIREENWTWANLEHRMSEVYGAIANLAACCDATVDDVMAANLSKLQRRYGDAFAPEKSINRTA